VRSYVSRDLWAIGTSRTREQTSADGKHWRKYLRCWRCRISSDLEIIPYFSKLLPTLLIQALQHSPDSLCLLRHSTMETRGYSSTRCGIEAQSLYTHNICQATYTSSFPQSMDQNGSSRSTLDSKHTRSLFWIRRNRRWGMSCIALVMRHVRV
jgi:hypothetical protein